MKMESNISEELRQGIARVEALHAAEIAALGGYGAEVSGVTPDGRVVRGTLSPASTLDQRPHLVTVDGRRYALDAYTAA